MSIKDAKFLVSNSDVKKCPAPDKPEYAFIGRSNVGKSSLINMLTNKKSLAKTSSKPGKTQLINHFLIDNEWYLVDLPGYGFAKAPKKERVKWEQIIRNYILHRENLYCLFVLIDIRHEPQVIDLEFMEWLGLSQVPFVIVFTKADKLKPQSINTHTEKYTQKMLESWEIMPNFFITSSEKQIGKDEIVQFVEHINKNS